MIGRVGEVAALEEALDRAQSKPGCEAMTVIGEAGVENRHWRVELAARTADRALILHGHCPPHGQSSIYWPFERILNRLAGIDAADNPTAAIAEVEHLLAPTAGGDAQSLTSALASGLGLTDETTDAAEFNRAARRSLERLAGDQPLLLLIEDIHWAEAPLLDLIEHLVRFSRGTPILIVCLAQGNCWTIGQAGRSPAIRDPPPPPA